MDKIAYYQSQLDKELAQIPVFKQAEQQTGVPKVYLASGGALIVLLLVFFNFGAALIVNLIGFIYPAIASFHAIESSKGSDDTQWLTYWTVYAFLGLLDTFSETMLSWFPFWYLFKLVAVLYLALPQTKGAAVVYAKFMRPVLLQAFKGTDSKSTASSVAE